MIKTINVEIEKDTIVLVSPQKKLPIVNMVLNASDLFSFLDFQDGDRFKKIEKMKINDNPKKDEKERLKNNNIEKANLIIDVLNDIFKGIDEIYESNDYKESKKKLALENLANDKQDKGI